MLPSEGGGKEVKHDEDEEIEVEDEEVVVEEKKPAPKVARRRQWVLICINFLKARVRPSPFFSSLFSALNLS